MSTTLMPCLASCEQQPVNQFPYWSMTKVELTASAYALPIPCVDPVTTATQKDKHSFDYSFNCSKFAPILSFSSTDFEKQRVVGDAAL